jgi:hypothetical protein
MALKLNTDFIHARDERPAPFFRKRLAALEAELSKLKGGDVSDDDLSTDLGPAGPTPGSFIERVNIFEEGLNALFPYRSIKALTPKVADLEKQYEQLRGDGEWPNRISDLQQLQLHKTRLIQMDKQSVELEEQIMQRSKGGSQYIVKFGLIDPDKQIAQAMAFSPNDYERRNGEVRLAGLEQIESAWWAEVRALQKRLDEIRG